MTLCAVYTLHKDSLVVSFSINRTHGWRRNNHLIISLSPPRYSCFLKVVSMLHDVREEMRENEIFLQSSREWEDVVLIFRTL
jgi:hypothetical protein